MASKYALSLEQLFELYKNTDKATQTKISEWFPKFPTNGIELRNWYKHTRDGNIIYIVKIDTHAYGYGQANDLSGIKWADYRYTEGRYCICNDVNLKYLTPASSNEVEKFLINEAISRGFKNGAKISTPWINWAVRTMTDNFKFSFDKNELLVEKIGGTWLTIYKDGEWAKVIEPIVEDSSVSMVKEETPPTQEEINRVLQYLESLKPFVNIQPKKED